PIRMAGAFHRHFHITNIRDDQGLRVEKRVFVVKGLRWSTLQSVLADQPFELGFATEVEQESDFEVSRTEVAEQLRGGGMKALRRLGFDNDLFVDDEVDYLSCECFALVVHHHSDLAIHAMPSRHELPLESAKVNQLTVAEAERAVDFVK